MPPTWLIPVIVQLVEYLLQRELSLAPMGVSVHSPEHLAHQARVAELEAILAKLKSGVIEEATVQQVLPQVLA